MEIELNQKMEEINNECFGKDNVSEELESKDLETKDRNSCEENERLEKTANKTRDLEERSDLDQKVESEDDSEETAKNLSDNIDLSEGNKSVKSLPSNSSVTLEDNELKSNSEDHELIIDTYNITFQKDWTGLEVDTDFDIYRIQIDNDIYTADEIRNNETSEKLIKAIEENITETFKNTVNSTFPDEEKEFNETKVDNTDSGDEGPIIVSCVADVEMTEVSYGFEEDDEQLNMSEMIDEILAVGASIRKDVNLNVSAGHNSTYRFGVTDPYLMKSNDTWGKWNEPTRNLGDRKEKISTWIYNNTGGDGNKTLHRTLNITHENPTLIESEDMRAIGMYDMKSFENISINITMEINTVNLDRYEDDFKMPDMIYDLDLIDADFIRTSVDNGLLEWKTITDKMNESVEDIENKMPSFFERVDFDYFDPGRVTGTIIREYKVENFQPNITADDEEVDIDNELTESLMNSGAVVDFGFSSMEEEYDDYSMLLKIWTPEFMELHNSSGEIPQQEGHYRIDPKEGFSGEFRSNQDEEELPDEQSVVLEMNIDIEKVTLKMDKSAIADANIDGQIEVSAVEAPEDMKDSLSEYITIDYATADLLRQVEKRSIFDKQRIINMTKNGEDMKDFEGMNQILKDALGKEDLDISSRYQEGTWQSEDGDTDTQPIVLFLDSDFNVPLRETAGGTAFEIYSMDMGEFEIPSIEGIDTDFKIIFPSGIIGDVEETDTVNTGETSDSRSYIEVKTSGDSGEPIPINPELIITSGIFFSTDIYLHGAPLVIIPIIIISLIALGIGIKVVPFKNRKKKKLIREGMEDALIEENDPDRWLAYIPQEKIDKYEITQDTLFELGLEEELEEMRTEAGKGREHVPSSSAGVDEEAQWAEETGETSEGIDESPDAIQGEGEVKEETVSEETKEKESTDPHYLSQPYLSEDATDEEATEDLEEEEAEEETDESGGDA
ncbi:MAG: hypothetical protein KGY68_03475 [Candidatus Thermoplasmatota archaeon]|nr:hypothetical protein [Candidatus Thermoplasmatota archaeon]